MAFSLAEEFLGDLEEVDKDIVTVHGICSSTKDPWINTDSKSKWIERDLFDRSDARVIVFGYPIEDQRSSEIHKVAKNLLDCLLECRESLDEANRPLAFISQDFGGTIVKAALMIASQNHEKYGQIVNTTFALVFLGCPHRPEDRVSLVDSIAILLSCTRTIPVQGLVSKASSIASTIIEVNDLFLESGMLYRTRILNVVSDSLDSRQRVFAKAVSTMDWSLETWIAFPTDHASLLCGKTGKEYFDTVRGFLHFDDDLLCPYEKYPVGLNYMISQLPTVRLQPSASGVIQDVLSRLDGLSEWIQGQEPFLVHIEHPPDQRLPLHTIVRLLESQPSAVRGRVRMFTFELRAGDHRSDSIMAALSILVVQAVCYILPRSPGESLPERLMKILDWSNPTSEVFALFEMVNVLFAKHRLQPLWVLWNIDQSSSDGAALIGQLRDCCKFSEVKPHILFSSNEDHEISSALRHFNIGRLISGPSNLESGANFDIEALMAQNPHLNPHDYIIESMLQQFSQDPKMFQVMFRSIQKLDESEVINHTYDQPDQPETVFKMLYDSFSAGERRQIARLLRWIDSSFRPLTISEVTMVISLEVFLEMNSQLPWSSLAAVLFSNARKQVERFEQSLCGIVLLDSNEIGFSHPTVRRLSLESGWYSAGIEAHLRILDRLLCFLEVEADPLGCEARDVAVLNSCQFRHYAAHYWPEHYRIASQDEATKIQANFHVKNFLANDCAVQYALTLDDGPTYTEATPTAASRRVALLAKHGFEINNIEYLTDCLDLLGDAELLFAALMGAVGGSSQSFVEQVPISPSLDLSRAERVLFKASMCSSPEFLNLIFEKISPIPEIKVPIAFLQKAAELGVQTVLDSVLEHPEMLEKQKVGLLIRKCALSGHTEVAKRLVKIGSFKGSDLEKLLDSVLSEACQNGDPGTIRSVLTNFPGNHDFTWWSHLTTACESGNREAVQETLQSIGNITSDMLAEHDDALRLAVEDGHAECAAIILARLDAADPTVKQIMCDALLLGVRNDQLRTCRVLLERCPDIMDNPVTARFNLKEAIWQDDLELVKLLVDHGAPIDADMGEVTPLHKASQYGHAATVEYLLQKGADVNARTGNPFNATPLYDACFNNKPGVVRHLLEYGADPRLELDDEWSPLEAAYDFPDILQMLVNHSPRPDSKRCVEYNGGHATALFLAAANNCIESVRILLQHDVDIQFEREEDSDSWQCFTALTVAVFEESSDTIVRMLLEHGADVDHIETNSGIHLLARARNEKTLTTILEYNPNLPGLGMGLNAVCSGQMGSSPDCARRLINAGAPLEAIDTRDQEGDTPLTNACRNDKRELIELLIERGASVNGISASKDGWPLHVACTYGGLDAVKLLVDKYAADVNRHHELRGSPLQSCLKGGLETILKIEFLMQRGADVNAKGALLYNLLTEACARASLSLVRYLVDYGAEVTAAEDVGCPPVFAACFRSTGGKELVQILMSSGADVSATARDKIGRTALHCAVLSGDLDLVDCLLAADPTLISTQDFDGWTPIHWAIRSTHDLFTGPEDLQPATSEKQVAMIRYLVDRHCPGINSTVKVGSGAEWTAIRIARYFRAPKTVQNVLIELTQTNDEVEDDDTTRDHKVQFKLEEKGFCDECLCNTGGRVFVCQAPSCWKYFWLCIKCVEHKDNIHPFDGHNFVEYEGYEVEEDTTEDSDYDDD